MLEENKVQFLGNQDPVGKCHICRFNAQIRFCPVCGHWFCSSCRKLYFKRGLEALKEMIHGTAPQCCGIEGEK